MNEPVHTSSSSSPASTEAVRRGGRADVQAQRAAARDEPWNVEERERGATNVRPTEFVVGNDDEFEEPEELRQRREHEEENHPVCREWCEMFFAARGTRALAWIPNIRESRDLAVSTRCRRRDSLGTREGSKARQSLEFAERLFVREAGESINRPMQYWEPRLLRSGTRATMRRPEVSVALPQEASKLEAARNHVQRTPGGVPMGGLNAELSRGSSNQRTETCHRILTGEAAHGLASPRPEVVQGQAVRSMYVLKSDIAKHGATLGCKAYPFVSRGAKSSVRHSDVCMHRIVKAVEMDDEGRIRTVFDENSPRRPALGVAGGGRAAPAVAQPAAAVLTAREAPSCSSAGGAQTMRVHSTKEDSRAVQRRRPRQIRVRAAVFLGRRRLSVKRASETNAEQLEPENS